MRGLPGGGQQPRGLRGDLHGRPGVLLDVAGRAEASEPSEHSLPPLEPRRMAKLEVCTTARASAHKMEDKPRQPEDELEPQDEPAKRQRLLQLSGFMIEVLDRDDELDEPSLPFSFQVNTYKMHLRPDGSSSSTLSDSLILSATDEEAKKLWVKNIKFWNRYGWRDTVQVAATHDDLVKLRETLQNYSTRSSWAPTRATAVMTPTAETATAPCSTAAAAASSRPALRDARPDDGSTARLCRDRSRRRPECKTSVCHATGCT